MSLLGKLIKKVVPVAVVGNVISNATKKESATTPTTTVATIPADIKTATIENGGVLGSKVLTTVTETIGATGQEIVLDALDAFLNTEEGKKVKKRVIIHYFKELWFIVAPLLILSAYGLFCLIKTIVKSLRKN